MAVDILIVDDSAAIRKILQRVLLQAEVPIGKVLEAGDGLEALSQLKEHKVGLILSDINMPNMDGLQLLSEIKANAEYKNLPVLMITTEGAQAKVLEAVNLGAVGYVRKPFTAEQIKEKLVGLL
jgi:two-component system, chemotaxis family, chemotaxis protein CheY